MEPPPNNAGPGAPADSQDSRRPSGRESRSRWSNRQRSNSAYSSYRSGLIQPGSLTNTGPASLDYSSFRLVADRNIFDPNRRPHIIRQPDQPIYHPRDGDYFTLVGTMSYEEGTFAFFNGSSSQYQASMKCGGIIGGYKVAAIDSDDVKLSQGTNEIALRIGMQMRREQDGTWTKSDAPSSYTVSSFEPTPASTSSSAPGDASSGPENEVLKRLMEKREKE
jgi:hypothetical protein